VEHSYRSHSRRGAEAATGSETHLPEPRWKACTGTARRVRKRDLEAATGVEPVMEVLQLSDGGGCEYWPGCDCAARSTLLASTRDLGCVGVAWRGVASRQRDVGIGAAPLENLSTRRGIARATTLRDASARCKGASAHRARDRMGGQSDRGGRGAPAIQRRAPLSDAPTAHAALPAPRRRALPEG